MRAQIIIGMLLLTSCVHTPQSIMGVNDDYLCRYAREPFTHQVFQTHKDEINRRQLITPEEWKLVDAHEIQIGMSKCAMYASWGSPYRENEYQTALGERIQHVYGTYDFGSRPTFIYTRNGKVTGWNK